MKKHFLPALLSFIILFSFGAMLVHAQTSTGGAGGTSSTGGAGGTSSTGTTPPVSITIDNPFSNATNGDGSIITLFNTILKNIVVPIGAVLCVLAFIYAGFLYVTAGGSKDGTKGARNMLLNAAIGTVLVLGASAIATVISATINQIQH